MPNGYTYNHCLWLAGEAYSSENLTPDQFEIMLYDDAEDDIGYNDDIGDITTEPEGGNYSRAVLEFPADLEVRAREGDRFVHVQPYEAYFDFEETTGEVDTAGIVWEANLPGDDTAQPHLMVRCELDDRHDLADHTGPYEVQPAWQLHTLF